jgi:flagellar hook-basal body complex protein FliE
MPAIDTSMLAAGPEWQIAAPELNVPVEGADGLGVDSLGGGAGSGGGGFGSVLGNQLQNLANLQTEAAGASAALANGTASDPSSVVMAVERARLSMQLASQLRTKGVEALNEVFRTQV